MTLEELKEKGLIDLTYELRSYVKSDYLIFKNSKLWKELEDAVTEAQEQRRMANVDIEV